MTVQVRPPRNCPQCQRSFHPLDAQQQFCSRPCFYLHRALADIRQKGNALQRLTTVRIGARRCRLKDAARGAHIGYSAFRGWLNHPGRLLSSPLLRRLAGWLQISVDEAIALQGGTREEERRNMLATHALPAAIRWRRDKRNHKKIQKQLQALREASSRPRSKQHQAKLTRALRAYRRGESPRRKKPHPLGTHHRTPRGRVQQLRRALRKHHPQLSEAALNGECLRRLQALGHPFAGRDAIIATMLLSPRSELAHRQRGKPSLIDRDVLIFDMRRQGAAWVQIAAAVNHREKADWSAESLQIYYNRTPSYRTA